MKKKSPTYQYIEVENINHSITSITLNRPEKRNALNLTLMDELIEAFVALHRQSKQRIVILAAKGAAFCSGLDLYEAADPLLVEDMAVRIGRLLSTVYTSPLVTLACLQGDALAGGAGLALACDFTLAAKEAKIGFPEVRRGLVAAQVATILCRKVSMHDASELLLLGELVDAHRANTIGIIHRIVEGEDLLSAAIDIAELVLQGGPEAIKKTKELLIKMPSSSFFEDLKIALDFHCSSRHGKEAKEGISAFLEKRSPKWINESKKR